MRATTTGNNYTYARVSLADVTTVDATQSSLIRDVTGDVTTSSFSGGRRAAEMPFLHADVTTSNGDRLRPAKAMDSSSRSPCQSRRRLTEKSSGTDHWGTVEKYRQPDHPTTCCNAYYRVLDDLRDRIRLMNTCATEWPMSRTTFAPEKFSICGHRGKRAFRTTAQFIVVYRTETLIPC